MGYRKARASWILVVSAASVLAGSVYAQDYDTTKLDALIKDFVEEFNTLVIDDIEQFIPTENEAPPEQDVTMGKGDVMPEGRGPAQSAPTPPAESIEAPPKLTLEDADLPSCQLKLVEIYENIDVIAGKYPAMKKKLAKVSEDVGELRNIAISRAGDPAGCPKSILRRVEATRQDLLRLDYQSLSSEAQEMIQCIGLKTVELENAKKEALAEGDNLQVERINSIESDLLEWDSKIVSLASEITASGRERGRYLEVLTNVTEQCLATEF